MQNVLQVQYKCNSTSIIYQSFICEWLIFTPTVQIWGCEGSGLFHAFSRHMLHRLGVHGRKEGTGDGRVHITILSRQTKYRQILNEAQLLDALRKEENYVVRRVR